jgi:hypothetical protein
MRTCKATNRSRTIHRCCAHAAVSPGTQRERKQSRNASNARQKRVADAKFPKPRMGSYRCLLPRWSCSIRLLRYVFVRCTTSFPMVSRMARGEERGPSVVTCSGVWATTATACSKNRFAASLSRFSAQPRINQIAIVIHGSGEIAPFPLDLAGRFVHLPGYSGLPTSRGFAIVLPATGQSVLPHLELPHVERRSLALKTSGRDHASSASSAVARKSRAEPCLWGIRGR